MLNTLWTQMLNIQKTKNRLRNIHRPLGSMVLQRFKIPINLFHHPLIEWDHLMAFGETQKATVTPGVRNHHKLTVSRKNVRHNYSNNRRIRSLSDFITHSITISDSFSATPISRTSIKKNFIKKTIPPCVADRLIYIIIARPINICKTALHQYHNLLWRLYDGH